MTTRYAIYYTPEPTSALAQKAACWLGRSPFSEVPAPQSPVASIAPQRLAEITRSPRHYGFHGTLKPPFHLKSGRTVEELQDKLSDFAAQRHATITIPKLDLSLMQNFFCLRPAEESSSLQGLAADIVREFDQFRAPAVPEELARRRASGLTDKQEQMLSCWGYPYVMNEFRFHLTLTGKLTDREEIQLIEKELQQRFRLQLEQGLQVQALTLFVEHNGAPLQAVHNFPFATT